jgi:hypothetical protein
VGADTCGIIGVANARAIGSRSSSSISTSAGVLVACVSPQGPP